MNIGTDSLSCDRCFPIRDTLRHELTWSHYRRLISVENEQARIWYMNEAADSVWSTRQMDRQISTLYYERLLASKDKAPVVAEAKQKMSELKPEQFIHDPFVLEFLNLKEYPALRESDIEQALIDHLQQFLLELGRGFCFVARQKRMRYDEDDFYVDLVFYHSILKCHVLTNPELRKPCTRLLHRSASMPTVSSSAYKWNRQRPFLNYSTIPT